MTTLIVKPINLSEPGSYRQRKAVLHLIGQLDKTRDSRDSGAIVSLMEQADNLIRGHLRTDDGSPVEGVLDRLSANEFDQLLSAIAFEGGDPVGEVS